MQSEIFCIFISLLLFICSCCLLMFIFDRGGGWHLFPLIPWSLNTGMNATICITIRNAIQECVCSQNVFFRWTTKHYAHEIIWFTQYHTHEWICCNTLKSTSVNSRVLWKPFCCKMAQAISVSLVFIWHPWTSKYTGRQAMLQWR